MIKHFGVQSYSRGKDETLRSMIEVTQEDYKTFFEERFLLS